MVGVPDICWIMNYDLKASVTCSCFLFIYDLQDESQMNSWSNFGIIIV